MASVADALVQARQAYQGGDHRRAAQLCQEVLRADAAQPAALALLGGMALTQGDLIEAARCYERALQLSPADAGCRNGLGVALLRQGRLEDALVHFREAVRLAPQSPEPFNNLALALRLHGRLDEARDCMQQALRLLPLSADAHFNLGLILQAQGNAAQAVANYREALRLRPDYAEASCALGGVLKDLGRLDEAEEQLRHAVARRPDWAEPLHLLGLVLQRLGRLTESEAVLRQVTRMRPDHFAYNNLGVTLSLQGHLEEAAAHFRHALWLRPDYPKGFVNLGHTLREVGAIEEADAAFQQAVRLQPDGAEAHRALGYLALLQGDFERGWSELERCRQLDPSPAARRHADRPLWDGSDLSGRTILLYADQGFGDTMQFVRFAPLVKRFGGTVLVECQPALVRLLARCAGVDQVFAEDTPLPAHDVQSPLMRLPLILGTRLGTIPAQVPYLHAEPDVVVQWRQHLEALDGFKIGITWQGDPRNGNDRTRSIPLERFAPLALLKGVRLISLQKGFGREQLPAFVSRFPITDLGERLDETTDGFVETPAVMRALDLVIAPDTGVAHLAGGLGVPVWMALAFVPDWRWLLHREDTPWYPTMRLFRQARRGDWDSVFARMAREVTRLVAEKDGG
jgi:tetratricopeptide (TPR) repeat protein